MGSLVHATGKRPNQTYRVYGAWGERRFPEIRSKADLYALLRRELVMPATAGRTEVVMALLDRDWDQAKQQWVDDFRTQLKRARAEAGLSQAELAERAGLSVQAVAAYEQGTSSPTWGVVRRLSRTLGKQFTVTSAEDIPEDTPSTPLTLPLSYQTVARIVDEINARVRGAGQHRISRFQEIRKELKGLSRVPTRELFRKFENETWAFHHGGRTELQFNVGLEPLEGKEHLRHGVAFSFETSQTLPSIDVLVPKVERFNEFLRVHPEKLLDLRMWHWRGDWRSDDREPSPIPPELVRPGVFVFLGRHRTTEGGIDYEAILDDFDRLLPVYEFVEGTSSFPEVTPAASGFHFRAGSTVKRARTTATIAERQLDVDLRHNQLQETLHRVLSQRFGAEAVGTELPNGTGDRIDAVVKQNGEYWFYEIKTALSARACIREALAQLLEYAYWPGAQQARHLIIVGEPELDDAARVYLGRLRQQFSLPVHYQQLILERGVLIPAALDL